MFATSAYGTAMLLAAAPLAQEAPAPANAAPPAVIAPDPQTIAPSLSAEPSPAIPVAPVPPAPAPAPRRLESEIVVEGRKGGGTPIEQVNVESFAVAQEIDEAVFGPVARAYGKSVPRPIRKGLRNVLTNLREPIVAANYLLQLKVGKAGETLGRFAINSTIGIAGLIDQAKRKPFNLPRRRNSFANTLGFYGVKPGPFFYLPLIGATTLRDLFGNVVDQLAVPSVTVKPFDQSQYMAPIGVLSALDARFEFEEELQERRAGRDPYGTTKQIYLDRRQAEIDALRSPRKARIAK